jgi:hypothetical protein
MTVHDKRVGRWQRLLRWAVMDSGIWIDWREQRYRP